MTTLVNAEKERMFNKSLDDLQLAIEVLQGEIERWSSIPENLQDVAKASKVQELLETFQILDNELSSYFLDIERKMTSLDGHRRDLQSSIDANPDVHD